MKFLIKYSLSGGFGGIKFADGEIFEFNSKPDAYDYSYDCACDLYDSLCGSSGLRTVEEIVEDDGVDKAEASLIYEEERESWIEYSAEEVK